MRLLQSNSARLLAVVASAVFLVAVACGSDPTPTPMPTPEPTTTPIPTPTPTPPATPTPRPTATPTPVPIPGRESVIPAEATLIIDAKPSALLNSPVLAPALDMVIGGTGNAEGVVVEFERETGISLQSLEYVELFVDLETALELAKPQGEAQRLPDFGAALHGDFDEDDFILRLETAGQQDPSQAYDAVDHREYKVYVDAGRNPYSFAFAFPDEDTLLLGSERSVKAMLDVAEGITPQVSGEGVITLEAMGGRDIGIIMALPPEALQGASDAQGDAGVVGVLSAGALTAPLTVVGVSLGEDSIQVESREIYDDESDAIAAKEFSESTMAMVGAISGSPDIQGVIANTSVVHSGRQVSYSMSLDSTSVSAILEFLSSLLSLGESGP